MGLVSSDITSVMTPKAVRQHRTKHTQHPRGSAAFRVTHSSGAKQLTTMRAGEGEGDLLPTCFPKWESLQTGHWERMGWGSERGRKHKMNSVVSLKFGNRWQSNACEGWKASALGSLFSGRTARKWRCDCPLRGLLCSYGFPGVAA